MHRADRAEALVGALADVLAVPAAAADPFEPEVVAVPSRGIERWLAQELSTRLGTSPRRRDGVCANVAFPFPQAVVGWAVHPTGGRFDPHRASSADDPWAPRRLAWSLLELLDGGVVPTDRLGGLGAHLAGEHGRGRRLPALRHVADLFDRYAVHRPVMVRAWQDGHDVDAAGRELPPGLAWQPLLWRAARSLLDRPSFAERVAELDHAAPVPGLPRRLSLYGLTALPASYVEVLDHLAASHEVHLFLLHPSPASWDRVAASTGAIAGTPAGRPRRVDDDSAAGVRHPLLVSWGRDSRELQVVLAGRGDGAADAIVAPDTGGDGSSTLLARLQQDLRDDRRPPGRPVRSDQPDRRLPLVRGAGGRAEDRSLQVHACHGRLRQVEVLRDAVLGLLSDDPTIQPRDVVVMCPDVEAYAPLVDAVFGADARLDRDGVDEAFDGVVGERLPDVRVRLADRSLRQVNPLLRTVADLLLVPDGRLEATAVVDLARRGPVRRRFGWDDDDLGTVEDWVRDLGIRWGLDAGHRVDHGVGSDAATWRRGLDRLLVGVAVAEDGTRLVAGVLPHDDVEGTTVDLAGRLAEYLERLGSVRRDLAAPRPVAVWCDDLTTAVDLLTASGPDELWQRLQLDGLLDTVREEAAGADPTLAVTLPELRSLLDDALRGRPSRANHRTGDLTVCSLVPMRSVPYRVVCLLGLDDEVFPRRTTAAGDDLVARDPLVGDRDPRTEDRQLLLDALLAAGDHVVVTYSGRDPRSDHEVPPAVPLAELLDVVDGTAVPADGRGRARDLVVHQHPLRAADPRSFDPVAPFGFDPVARAAAAAVGDGPPVRFLDGLPAAAPPPTTVEWGDFARFLMHPVKGWLRDRLGVSLSGRDDLLDDLLPVDLDKLDEWHVGTRLLDAALAGRLDAAVEAERARGRLPAGRIGDATIADVRAGVARLADAVGVEVGSLWDQQAATVELDLRVGDLHLVGAVEDVRPSALARVGYGRQKPKRVLALWLAWLALQGQGCGRPAVMVTRGKDDRAGPQLTRFGGDLDPRGAATRLERLARLYVRGHDQPLLLFEEVSGTYCARLRDKGPAAATKVVRDDWIVRLHDGRQWGDGLDPCVVAVLGEVEADDLLAHPPLEGEDGPGFEVGEASRFGRLARHLWDPVLDDCAAG